VLSLVLICHSSYRGVIQLLAALFDTSISLGTIHNLLVDTSNQAGRNWSKRFGTVRLPPGSISTCTGGLISRMSVWSIRWAWQFPKIRTGNRT